MDNISQIISRSIGGYSIGSILSALLTFLICLIVVRLVLKLCSRLLSRANRLNERLQKVILTSLKTLLYLLTIIITAEALGINTSSLTAIMSVLTLGVTLAAEDILGNVAGGLVILFSHPFSLGDEIEVGGTTGTVREISLTHTKIETPDGQIVLQPNREMSSSKIINFTVLGRRRVTRKITASYDAPTQKVIDALVQAGTMDNVLLTPAPSACVSSYGDSAIAYTLRVWVKTEDYWDVYFALTQRVKDVFDEQGIAMTYPHLNVHLDK